MRGFSFVNLASEVIEALPLILIVDVADPSRSIGVYPGGQSGNPADPHYADLIPLWAQGKYTPLNMVGREEALKKRGEFKSTRFTP